MAGGPGQGASGMAGAAARYFRQVRRHRDIVLVDLRGTGASHPLRCEAGDELAALSDRDVTGVARRCAGTLDADPRFYTHRESLADLDEIRQRLGYARINLWGGSWGTRAALLYALRYPAATRSAVLDGAVALTLDFPLTASADAQAALDRAIGDCEADRDCHAAFPNPRADLDRLLARFAAGDVAVTVRHPRTYAPASTTLSRGIVMDILRGALYVPRDATGAMHLVKQAADGDFAPLLAQYARTASWSTDDMAMAATMAILCSEDVPAVGAASIAAASAGLAPPQRRREGGPAAPRRPREGGSLFGTTYADGWRARCAGWPAGRRLDESRDAVSDAPALILSGGRDPVTPPRAGELMTRHFPRHRHIVVDNAAHNTSFTGCVPRLIAQFIEDGHGDALDGGCVADVAWPPFTVATQGSRP
jgi:pimeloyl-ACP methyl ester carboxylesterase